MPVYLISFPILNDGPNPLDKSPGRLTGVSLDIELNILNFVPKLGNKISILDIKNLSGLHLHKEIRISENLINGLVGNILPKQNAQTLYPKLNQPIRLVNFLQLTHLGPLQG